MTANIPDEAVDAAAAALLRYGLEVYDGQREAAADALAAALPVLERSIRDNTDGAGLITAERRRQVEVEGYSPDHDAAHDDDSLRRAANCYLNAPDFIDPIRRGIATVHGPLAGEPWAPTDWPWAARHWKPRPDNRVRELVKAGSLIAAEIDRLLARGSVATPNGEREAAVWCPCYGTREPSGPWVAPDDFHADAHVPDWELARDVATPNGDQA